MGEAARAPAVGKGFSRARGDPRAAQLERAAERGGNALRTARCRQPAASSALGQTGPNEAWQCVETGEVRAVDLISAVQTKGRETLKDRRFPAPIFVIGKS